MAAFFTNSAGNIIPEYTTDPVSPVAGTTWVLYSVYIGSPIGLLLSLTHTAYQYQLSYQTAEGAIIRTLLQ